MKRILPLLLLALIGAARPLAARSVTRIIHPSSESLAAWSAGELPLRIRLQEDQLILPLHFPRNDRQLLVTRSGNLDLSAQDSFRLRVSVTDPAPLLEATLSFRSGTGEYLTRFTLHESGAHHILLPKARFTASGSPAGWDRIDSVRLQFWPRKPGRTTLALSSLDAIQNTLWLVDAESAAQTPDERYIARVSLRHMERIVSGLGLPAAIVPLDSILEENADLLILPYLPRLSASSRRALLSQLDRGARLIVFEASDPELARRMGVDVGSQVQSSTVGTFDHLLPDRSLRPHTPARIYQHAWSMHSLRPRSGSEVTAVWADARGRRSNTAAVVESSSGVWLNYAWRSGDTGAKRQLTAEWIGRLAPGLLRDSLFFHAETRSPSQWSLRFDGADAESPASRRLREVARERFKQAGVRDRNQLDALRYFRESSQLMQRSFAAAQSDWPATVRGVWDQNGTGFYAGGWDDTARELKAAGFNAVFSNVASAGRAHYPSRHIPPSKTFEDHGDQLRAFAEAAKRHGLEAHAWKICWRLNTRLPAFQERMRREGRLMQDQQGNDIPWLSFSDPRNVEHEIQSLLEMARHAPLDGIHLDYMRYPGREADYGPAARRAFERQIGRPLPSWPEEVLGPLKEQFQTFRQQELHRAMQKISEALRKEFPDLTLSVAVWGAWPDCADAQGQDWPVWAARDWVDWLIPMNYTDNPDQFAGWLDLQTAQPGVRERLIPGIGVISTNAELEPFSVLRQLGLIRDRDLPGAVLYRLDPSLRTRLFPYLTPWN